MTESSNNGDGQEKVARGTLFQVLKGDEAGHWAEDGEPLRAGTHEAAIRRHTLMQDGSHEPGRWKAVPVRNWEGVVDIVTETRSVSTFNVS